MPHPTRRAVAGVLGAVLLMDVLRVAPSTPAGAVTERVSVAATATLSGPLAAGPTAKVKVTGAGFPTGSRLEVFFDAVNVTSAWADGGGGFVARFPIPTRAVTGRHWITALEPGTGTSAQRAIHVGVGWLHPRGSSALKGLNGQENLISSATVSTLAGTTTFQGPNAVSTPVVDAFGAAYVGTADGSVAKLPAGCGTGCAPAWRFEPAPSGNGPAVSPAVAGSTVLAAGGDGVLRAFPTSCADPCSSSWTGVTGGRVLHAPTVHGGRVYAGTDGGTVEAFDTAGCAGATCDPVWSTPLPGSVTAAPSVGFDQVYASTGPTLFALKRVGGAVVWERGLGSEMAGSAAFDWEAKSEPVAYVATRGGRMYAIKAVTGQSRWMVQIDAGFVGTPAVGYALAYATADDGRLYAFRSWGCPNPCEPAWNVEVGGIPSDPFLANGLVYVASSDGSVHAFNARNGEALWSEDLGSPTGAGPVVVNGALFVGADDGGLRVFRLDPKPTPPPQPDPADLAPVEGPIRHVVVLFQENQSFDSVLGFMCVQDGRCDGAKQGDLHTGEVVPLRTGREVVPKVGHAAWHQVTAINGGQMNGFDKIQGCGALTEHACYQQYRPWQIPALAALARSFVVADATYESEAGPSWGSHFILASGNLDGFVNGNPGFNPDVPGPITWGCDSNMLIPWIGPNGQRVTVPSCVPKPDGSGPFRPSPVEWVPTIMDRLDEAGLTWRIYHPSNFWSVCPTFADCLFDPQRNNTLATDQVIVEAANGALPSLSLVIPSWADSQHNGAAMANGDRWIADVVDAIMQGPDWRSTAIFITYDDCGCFYDHAPPPAGMGIRVPMVIVSPYAKAGFTDTGIARFESMLAFAERVFDVPPLFTTDATAYDFWDSFDFDQEPLGPIALPRRKTPGAAQAWIERHRGGGQYT